MAFRTRTNAYWEKRAQEQLTLVEQQALPHLLAIDKAYRDAQRYTLEEVKKIYVAYYRSQGFDVSALQDIAPRGDIRRFQEAVRAAGLLDRLPDGYGFRLTRLELLEAQLWLKAHETALKQTAFQTAAHAQTIDTAYYYSLYNLSKGTGVAPSFAKLNEATVDRILSSRLAGKHFSERIWRHSDQLAGELKQILSTSVASGQPQAKTARLVRDRYGVTRYQAQRLIATETNYYNTLATDESYRSVGLDEWVFVATLDSRTDDDCAAHDGKRYRLGSGPTIPLHGNCRCTKRAYIGEGYEPDERIMRGPDGKNRYISNVSFSQWQALHP